MTVNGSTVKADAWTVFEKRACGGIVPNARVEADAACRAQPRDKTGIVTQIRELFGIRGTVLCSTSGAESTLSIVIGRTVGKYRIIEQLGRGASGIVYKAVDETLDREVAIKVLNPDLANPEIMRRFHGEATTLAKLNHPGIATIYELVQSGSDLLMVMEFVRGETLEELATRLGPLPPERAAELVTDILAALDYAHRAGIVHRDMKPANVMLTELGKVKIMDFGIARVRGAEHMTLDGSLIGTPAYMAPEQVLGGEIDGRADLYSVGVVFYRLLTGTLPFAADSPIVMLQQQLAQPPAPLSTYREGLPDWCEQVVNRALAKSAADRFQTAEEFREALRRGANVSDTAPAKPSTRKDQQGITDRGLWAVAGRAGTAVRTWRFSSVGVLVAVLATAVALSYPVVRRAASRSMAATLPPVAFNAKVLSGSGAKQRERDARFVLADGAVTVTAAGNPLHVIHSVPYHNVISISYSRGAHPVWKSPGGPALVARVDGGVLAKLGVLVERHWITFQTSPSDALVAVRFDEDQIRSVLQAVEERVDLTPERVR